MTFLSGAYSSPALVEIGGGGGGAVRGLVTFKLGVEGRPFLMFASAPPSPLVMRARGRRAGGGGREGRERHTPRTVMYCTRAGTRTHKHTWSEQGWAGGVSQDG